MKRETATKSYYLGERAIVVGGGVAGLSAARAVSDRFRQVVILDRDELPDGATPRPGVPQGKHPHGLLAGGLKTEAFPRADTHEAVMEVIGRLRVAGDDLTAKLVIAGFTLGPIDYDGIEQACETCMYYLVHRRYCELPELAVAVEPEWSCRLWRI